MIDDFDTTNTGWARFSLDRTKRYRLARSLKPTIRLGIDPATQNLTTIVHAFTGNTVIEPIRRIVFVMLNPSTADAFQVDPTIAKCIKFARRWEGDVVEVVNLFALRSPYPESLRQSADRGADEWNDLAIMNACRGAARVIAAWGNHGALDHRGEVVRTMLIAAGVRLEHLGLTGMSTDPVRYPMHPLARGKKFIPIEREPEVWA